MPVTIAALPLKSNNSRSDEADMSYFLPLGGFDVLRVAGASF